MQENKVALITGSAKRVGACIAKILHASGLQIVIHYHHSEKAADALCDHFNQQRPHSAKTIKADLTHTPSIPQLLSQATAFWGRLDVLINNAAVFNSISLSSMTLEHWQTTLASNLTAPFYLSLNAAPYLKANQGCIINLLDIRAHQPLKNYTPYCISKAGLAMATKSLALEWAPDIRVNGIAPGVVLWSDESTISDEKMHTQVIKRTPLKRVGTPEDIAKTARFLIQDAPYITGQIISVDGGRSLAY